MAPADYNRDGFTDIYLTRSSSEPFFFKAAAAAGTTQNNWLGVRLSPPTAPTTPPASAPR